ncbi:MAG: hypothetical protein ACJ75H_04125 [Thermoanaerobaculia bacterium]
MRAVSADRPARPTRSEPRTPSRHPEIETALQIQFRGVESLLLVMEALSGRSVPRRPRRR